MYRKKTRALSIKFNSLGLSQSSGGLFLAGSLDWDFSVFCKDGRHNDILNIILSDA